MSIAVENFVKVVYQFEQNLAFDTKPGTIARALGITNAAATDMSRKLSEKKLIQYEKYKALQLTENGRKMALRVIRKHRLWEAFLFEVFHMSLHEIHREAELLEHQTSDFMVERINSYLGFPEFDPHGEPIPNSRGDVKIMKEQHILAFVHARKEYEITCLESSDREFFDFCNQNDIHIGARIKVLSQYEKMNITEIRAGERKILLNREFASIMYVKPL